MQQKLESLRKCVHRIAQKMPSTLEELQSDIDAQDIIALNLTRAVQLCVDIAAHWISEQNHLDAPKTMSESFTILANAKLIDGDLANRLRNAVGFRNIMVHSYDDIDWAIVYAIGAKHLEDFKQFAKAFVLNPNGESSA